MYEGVDGIYSPNDLFRGQIIEEQNGKLKAPENIVKSIYGAKALYFQYRQEHLPRIDLAAQLEGLFAGNAPYDPADLAKNRLSHIANFNDLSARGYFERSALAYWNLLNEVQYIATFEIPGPEPENVTYSNILARHFNDVLRLWPSFNTEVNTLSAQLVKFGVSPALWPDERDWRFRTVEYARFYVSNQAQVSPDRLTAVCVESAFTVQYLYECYDYFFIKNKGTATDSPWSESELSGLLLYFANSYFKDDRAIRDMMDLQHRLQNNDLTLTTMFSDDLRLVSLFYKEYDGKISHYMFHPYYDRGDFLYFADRQYPSMQDAILIFTASPGEFTIHSNRGLGHKIFSVSQAMMMLNCSVVDMARMSSTPLIKTVNYGNNEFDSIRFYPGVPTNLGTAEFVQNKLGENISELIVAARYMDEKIQANTANSGDDPGVPDRNVGSISPSQARMKTFKEFNVLKNSVAHFYSMFDIVIRNIAVKMLKSKKGYPGYEYAKEWKDRCVAEGVPEEIFQVSDLDFFNFPKKLKVYASRVAGDGSTLARIMGLQELSAIAPTFTAKGLDEYKRQWVMATMGPGYVQSFLPPAPPDEIAGGASLAGVENAVMQMGQSPIFSPDNEHRAHIVTHLALGNNLVKQLNEQQLDARGADKIFTVLIPHLADHLEAISQSIYSRQFLEQVKGPWAQLERYAILNRKNAAEQIKSQLRKQQEAEQNQQRVMSEEELKNFQVQGDERRADFKVNSQVERAKDANRNRAEVMREKVHLDADNDRVRIQTEGQLKQQESAAELRQELAGINGQTISPYDYEKSKRPAPLTIE